MKKVWIQQWEESERGWGCRPDGFTAHLKKEDIEKYLSAMRAEEKKLYGDTVPDEYSRPCGEPFEHELSAEAVKKIKGNGMVLSYDWKPNPEIDKARVGGWKSVKG